MSRSLAQLIVWAFYTPAPPLELRQRLLRWLVRLLVFLICLVALIWLTFGPPSWQ